MTIAMGSDHAGFELKRQIFERLQAENYNVTDLGTDSKESTDYPDFGVKVGKAVANGEYDFGIIMCGTGIGISISANKVRGVRAALCSTDYDAEMARKHNNANILALGGRTITIDLAMRMVHIFLKTEFEGGRHETRVNKIHSLTQR